MSSVHLYRAHTFCYTGGSGIPNPEEIEALTLEGMREAVMAQLQPQQH